MIENKNITYQTTAHHNCTALPYVSIPYKTTKLCLVICTDYFCQNTLKLF
jgi:hypothetical protein